MYQEFYARSGLLVWPLVGLILFLAVFIGVLAFTFFGLRDRRRIDELAALPLEPDSGIDSPAEGRAR
ncbi:MAG: CcoQ/FixQ family Cbb3-type cytochrome c oxidase assembly chaperone [Candidatus Krumholzibacteriia bacterium]